MNKKNIFLISITGLLFLLVFLIFISSQVKNSQKYIQPISSPTPIPSFFPRYTFPTVVYPDTDTIQIDEIEVKNFLKSSLRSTQSGDVLVFQDTGYDIVYFSSQKRFLITVLDSPFEDIRIEAEKELLRSLGVSKQEACKLDVEIGTPRFANEDLAGQSFQLSFCAVPVK